MKRTRQLTKRSLGLFSDKIRLEAFKEDVCSFDDVFQTTVSAPNAGAATTRYRFAHPRWCPEHQSHHGYRLIVEERPDGSTVETYRHQNHGRSGRLAERTVYDELGDPIHRATEHWEVPEAGAVTGAWQDPSSADPRFDRSFVGRLAWSMSRNEYGASPGEQIGFQGSETFVYDDVHGFNFVAEIIGRRCGVYDLTKKEASLVLDRLTKSNNGGNGGGNGGGAPPP